LEKLVITSAKIMSLKGVEDLHPVRNTLLTQLMNDLRKGRSQELEGLRRNVMVNSIAKMTVAVVEKNRDRSHRPE